MHLYCTRRHFSLGLECTVVYNFLTYAYSDPEAIELMLMYLDINVYIHKCSYGMLSATYLSIYIYSYFFRWLQDCVPDAIITFAFISKSRKLSCLIYHFSFPQSFIFLTFFRVQISHIINFIYIEIELKLKSVNKLDCCMV